MSAPDPSGLLSESKKAEFPPPGTTGGSGGQLLSTSLLELANVLNYEGKSEWANAFLANLWPHIHAFIDRTLEEEVEPLIQNAAPPAFKSLHFTSRDVGRLPPQVSKVCVRPTHPLKPPPSESNQDSRSDRDRDVEDDEDDKNSGGPKEGDAGLKGGKRVKKEGYKENTSSAPDAFGENGAGGPPSLELALDLDFESPCSVGLKLGVLPIEVGLHRVAFIGPIILAFAPMEEEPPFFGGVQIYFPNVPEIDLEFTGPAKLGELPFLQRLVRKSILQALSSALVFPNRLAFSAIPAVDVVSLRHPPGRGVLRLTVVRAEGLESREGEWHRPTSFLKNSIADSFVEVTLGAQTWSTSTVTNDNHPVWNEREDLIVHDSSQQVLNMKVFDEEYLGLRSLLGSVKLPLRDFLSAAAQVAEEKDEEMIDDAVKAGRMTRHQADNTTNLQKPDATCDAPPRYRHILIQSAGGKGGAVGILIDGERHDVEGRGLRLVILSSITGEVMASRSFDVSQDNKEANNEAAALVKYLENEVPPSSVVLAAGSEDCDSWQLAREHLVAIGARCVRKGHGDAPGYQQSYILLGYKSATGLHLRGEAGEQVKEGELSPIVPPMPSWVRERVGPQQTCLRLSLTLAFQAMKQDDEKNDDYPPPLASWLDDIPGMNGGSSAKDEEKEKKDESLTTASTRHASASAKKLPVFRLPLIPPPKAPKDEIEQRADLEPPPSVSAEEAALTCEGGGNAQEIKRLNRDKDDFMALYLKVETFRLVPLLALEDSKPSTKPSPSSSCDASAMLWIAVSTASQIVAEASGKFKAVVTLFNKKRHVLARKETSIWKPPADIGKHCEKAKDELVRRKIDLLKERNCSCEDIAAVLDLPEDEIAAVLQEINPVAHASLPRPVWNEAFSFFLSDTESDTVQIQILRNNTIVVGELYWTLAAIRKLQIPNATDESEVDPGYEKLALHPAGSLTAKVRLFELRPSFT